MKNPAWNSPACRRAKASFGSLKKVTYLSAAMSAARDAERLLEDERLQDGDVEFLVGGAVARRRLRGPRPGR